MESASTGNVVILIELGLYLLGMLAIGIYFARKDLSQAEYHGGGKNLSGWALALSERSTGESAWLILGLTGAAYKTGLAEIWVAIGCVAGIIVSWQYLAKKFRQESEKYNALTYVDYFAFKYKSQATPIRWLASITMIFFFTLYVFAQFKGGGKVLNQTFGMDPTWGIVISAIVTIVYSTAGGFLAVVWTDVVQAILMIVTFLVTPCIAMWAVSSQGVSILDAIGKAGPGVGSWVKGLEGDAAFFLVFGNLAWFFGYLGGQPPLAARWMAMKEDEDVRKGKWVAIVWTLLAYIGAIYIGLSALALYGPDKVKDAEQILPFMLSQLLPGWLAGILLVGAIAAMMSTASSQLLLITSCISEDIWHKALKKEINDKMLVWISRAVMFGVGITGLILAVTLNDPVFSIVSWAWAGVGCSFSPAILLAFYWKDFSGMGVIAAIVSGFVASILGIFFGVFGRFSIMAATFCISLVCAVAASKVFPEKNTSTAS